MVPFIQKALTFIILIIAGILLFVVWGTKGWETVYNANLPWAD